LKEKIEEYKALKNLDRGQISKRNKKPTDNFEHLVRKKEGQASEDLKT
jgi:hypothetical protein